MLAAMWRRGVLFAIASGLLVVGCGATDAGGGAEPGYDQQEVCAIEPGYSPSDEPPTCPPR
jgi:hypothetical protein